MPSVVKIQNEKVSQVKPDLTWDEAYKLRDSLQEQQGDKVPFAKLRYAVRCDNPK